MQTTFIVKNLTDATMADLTAMEPRTMHDKLAKWAFGDLRHCVSVKYGRGSFGDRVDWNGKMKAGAPITARIESRKGYRLVTFEA